MSEAWEWVVAASKASVEALAERVAKLEVGRAELHDRCDSLSDAIGSLEQDALRPTREEASGQPATVPPGWKLAPGWSKRHPEDYSECTWGLTRWQSGCQLRHAFQGEAGMACPIHAVEMGALVEDEPPAEQPSPTKGCADCLLCGVCQTHAPGEHDERCHQGADADPMDIDAVVADMAAEQPSRQETGGDETAHACHPSCGTLEYNEGIPVGVFWCAPFCRDRAKAKAAEQDDDEDDGMCCHFNEVREAPRSCTKDRGHDGPHYYGPRPTTPAEPSGAGQVPSAPVDKHPGHDPFWCHAGCPSWKAEPPATAFPMDQIEGLPTPQRPPATAAGTLSECAREYWRERAKDGDVKLAALEARLAQAELFLAVKDKVVAGFEERCKEADKKLAQAERDKASATQSLVDEYDRRKKAERERDEVTAKLAGSVPRGVHIRAIQEAEAVNAQEIHDEATAKERERCASACEAMVVGGRAWSHDQQVAAEALLAAAKNIRSVQCDPGPPREVAPDRTQQGGGR